MPQARGLIQAYQIRDFAASEALALREAEVKDNQERFARARALRDLTSVWSDACDRIRILRGRPLPGSLRPEHKSKRAAPRVEGPLRRASKPASVPPASDTPA